MRAPVLLALLLAMTALFSVSNVMAGPITFTLSGTYGTITNSNPPSATTPFDNGSSFIFSFTVPTQSPIPVNFSTSPTLGFTQIRADGMSFSYTNGAVTIIATNQFPPSGCLVMFCGTVLLETVPNLSENGGLQFDIEHLYNAKDQLQLLLIGPQLFTGPANSPFIPTGTFQLQQDPTLTFGVRYSDGTNGGSATANANVIGNATLVISSTPEPATLTFICTGLFAIIGLRRLRRRAA